ncbi:hydroxyacylglutathione hydrolase [Alteromonas halophila]|uniref:Hydroxyacylglutathione hydrolase n=1 Tax=Alteromonas halophila TaxID=516698 RepID=A0A918JPM7_9ALTE|nr:hydroxyacylglutathione hydrolase [Alteromonas halophila]GGW95282.1 hydroxyacylglutathione hydrolase [Alteromonas halophila]
MTMDALPDTIRIIAIPAFTDNYIWCMHNDSHAIVVDPGDAEPVLTFLRKQGLSLAAVLITHHHHDHTGGITRLVSANPSVPVIGPRGNHIRGITKSVAQGDTLRLPIFDMAFSIIETPGHTLDHIAFYGHGLVFCGDTLFSCGCGRLFEGSPEQMAHSLNKLKRLPDDTLVYCTHEYTQANVTFSLAVDPENADLNNYADWVSAQREADKITLPSTIAKEKAVNPFLRCHTDNVQAAVAQYTGDSPADDTATFAGLRRWKDEF